MEIKSFCIEIYFVIEVKLHDNHKINRCGTTVDYVFHF